jgi:hypothetical protein
MKYRKKPIEIEAVQWTGSNADEIEEFIGQVWKAAPDRIRINTPEGTMVATPGDWIIRGVAGELYPCKPDIFEQTYEPVDNHRR